MPRRIKRAKLKKELQDSPTFNVGDSVAWTKSSKIRWASLDRGYFTCWSELFANALQGIFDGRAKSSDRAILARRTWTETLLVGARASRANGATDEMRWTSWSCIKQSTKAVLHASLLNFGLGAPRVIERMPDLKSRTKRLANIFKIHRERSTKSLKSGIVLSLTSRLLNAWGSCSEQQELMSNVYGSESCPALKNV